MSETIAPPPPSPRAPSGLSLLLIGAIVGGVAGAGAAVVIDRSRDGGALIPTATPPPSALPSAPSVTAGPVAQGDVVAVVQELSPGVVTVINRLASGQQQASGSGFLVDARRGYILTNSHVVSNVRGTGVGASFEVLFPDARKVAARLVGRDQETDVAVLEVGPQDVKPLILGNSDEVPIGSTVVAIGSALGDFRNSVTVGVVSGKGRRLPSETNQDLFIEDLVQTDAAISPGNSGGPLIWAATRQVIGMNTLVIREPGSEGLGFAVSSSTVRRIADELIRTGRVERGFIGISYQPVNARQAQALGLPASTTGVVVTEVVPGSAGAQAGLRAGDVVVRVNDQQIDPEHTLATIMLRFRPGDRVRLTIVRDGQERAMELTLGRRG